MSLVESIDLRGVWKLSKLILTSMQKFSRAPRVDTLRLWLSLILFLLNSVIISSWAGASSLSSYSLNLVNSISDQISIKCYFSDDLPIPYNANLGSIKSLLEEYHRIGGDKLSFIFIDPVKENKEQQARAYGIPAVPVQAVTRGKSEIKNVYMGLVVLCREKFETTPVVHNTRMLEYDITRAIKKLIHPFRWRVAFVTGHNELSLEKELTYLNNILSQEYSVESLNLRAMSSVPHDIQVVFLIGPETPLSQWEQYLLDQYLMSGGGLGILLDKTKVNTQSGTSTPLDPQIDPFLSNYGIGVNNNMVIDLQNNQILVHQQQDSFRFQSEKPYPFFAKITDLSKSNIIVMNLLRINMIFASSLDTSQFELTGLQYEILARTSKNSGILKPPYDIDPFRQWNKLDFKLQSLPIGVAVTGNFKSLYAGKPRPIPHKFSSTQFGAIPDTRLDQGDRGRLVVWGDADFVSDQSLRDQANLVMFKMMTEWLTEDYGLISIYSK